MPSVTLPHNSAGLSHDATINTFSAVSDPSQPFSRYHLTPQASNLASSPSRSRLSPSYPSPNRILELLPSSHDPAFENIEALLFEALSLENFPSFKKLLNYDRPINLMARNNNGQTLLHAAANIHPFLFKALLKTVAGPIDFNAEYEGKNILQAANKGAPSPNSPTILSFDNFYSLVKVGLDKQQIDPNKIIDGQTLLQITVTRGEEDLTMRLLREGANPNAKGDSGNTPLHVAVCVGDFSAVKALVEYGAGIEVENNEGKNAVQLALESRQKDLCLFFRDFDPAFTENYFEEIKFNQGDLIYGLNVPRQNLRNFLTSNFSDLNSCFIDAYNNPLAQSVWQKAVDGDQNMFEETEQAGANALLNANLDGTENQVLIKKNLPLAEAFITTISTKPKFNIKEIYREAVLNLGKDKFYNVFKIYSERYMLSGLFIKRGSKAGIEMTASKLHDRKIYFVLDNLDINAVIKKEEEQGKSITASELRYAYRRREALTDNLVFYKEGKSVPAPWATDPAAWERYKPSSRIQEKD